MRAAFAEAAGHLTRLCFRPMGHIWAYPTSQTDALRQLARQTGGATVFFGDAPSDQAAARAASVPFVAIGDNVPSSRQAMFDHAGTLSGLLGKEEQIAAAAALKLAIPRSGR
jgi:phosphoglycolate phosphatase-like HAD superfamily hydrolase